MRRQRGQTSAEYLGGVLVVAIVVAVLGSSSLGERIDKGIREAVCRIAGGECAPGERPPPSPAELVDRFIQAPLDQFIAARESAGRDPRLDWSSDDCSAPLVGSTGLSFDFTDACRRHDFGYRNTKDLGSFARHKAEIDARFHQDMYDHCATRNVFLRASCFGWADRFYWAVVTFG
jgi:Prokaryotic phospholipase A2